MMSRMARARHVHGGSPLPRLLALALVAGALLVPATYAAVHIGLNWHHEGFAAMRGTLCSPGRAVRAGASPYPSPTPVSNLAGSPSVYTPPLILVAGVPLSLLPFDAAAAAWALVLVAASASALALLGVRDRRCYALALLSIPVFGDVLGGNATPLLVLLVAAAWRYRDRPWAPGLALAGALTIKPFVAPLLVWLLVTGRRRSLLAAAAGSVLLALAGWAVIGFDGLRDYPHLVANLGGVAGPHGAGVYALARDLGAGHGTAEAAALLLAVVVLAAFRGTFESGVLASLLATPVIWAHYFALLFVVAAAASTTVSLLWLLPLALGPSTFYPGSVRPAWVTLAGLLAALVICARSAEGPAERGRGSLRLAQRRRPSATPAR
jgi:hypothetical protein